jgi:DNA primase
LGSNGELVGAVGRGIAPDVVPKYYNYFGFETGLTLGGLHEVTGQPRIGVCEGFFDLINVYDWAQEAGYDMVCTFTAKTSRQQAETLAGMNANIRYFYDMDKAGNDGWVKVQKVLKNISYGLKRVTWSDKNLDIGQMNRLNFEGALKGTTVTVTETIDDKMLEEI